MSIAHLFHSGRWLPAIALCLVLLASCAIQHPVKTTPTVPPPSFVERVACHYELDYVGYPVCYSFASLSNPKLRVNSFTWSQGKTLAAGMWQQDPVTKVWSFFFDIFQYNSDQPHVTWVPPSYDNLQIVVLWDRIDPFTCSYEQALTDLAHNMGISEKAPIGFDGEVICTN